MAQKDNITNEAVNVRKISKDEFKKSYFKTSEETAALASDLNENSTDIPVIEKEEAAIEGGFVAFFFFF